MLFKFKFIFYLNNNKYNNIVSKMMYNFNHNTFTIKEDNLKLSIYISDNEIYNTLVNEFLRLEKNNNIN